MMPTKLPCLILAILSLTFLNSIQAQVSGTGMTDADGNSYPSVIIGNQEWTAENLITTKYSNGDPVTQNFLDWADVTEGVWTYYQNDQAFDGTYGKYYNWYAAADPRNLCATGWHVPSKNDWEILVDHLGGILVAGGKLKETGTVHWSSPNAGATNETGFTALPGGQRSYTTLFELETFEARFWTATEFNSQEAYLRAPVFDEEGIYLDYTGKYFGMNVRCLKNSNPVGVIELDKTDKTLIYITDLTGRIVNPSPNQILLYHYSDNSIKKVFVSE